MIDDGPLGGEWTPRRVLHLAQASQIESLCATLSELPRLDGVHEELVTIAADLFKGRGSKRAERENMARRLNAAAAKLNTIRLAAS